MAASVKSTYFENIIGNHLTQLSPLQLFKQTSRLHVISIFCIAIETRYIKQPPRGVLKKKCSENMPQIYRRTPMPKSDLNKVALQLYLNHTSA